MSNSTIFTVGGTVQAGGGLYITREADEQLLSLCREGAFAYVLYTRQMGKSSLMINTANRLTSDGVRPVIIDLTAIGVEVAAETWYLGLVAEIVDQLGLDVELNKWWESAGHLSLVQRLGYFFQHVMLAQIAEPVVIFVDEIDTTLLLSFTDDFFAAIRYVYNARAHVDEFKRLSFVLLGVATPNQLVRDPQRTPFNIGQRVELTDFTYEEALPLASELNLRPDNTRQLLGWVLKWTGGHPYLTQRLFFLIAGEERDSWTDSEVDDLVIKSFLGQMSDQDSNLLFVRDMLTRRAPKDDAANVLTTYRKALRGQEPVADEQRSLVKSHLKLSGVVRSDNSVLRVRNRIYGTVFDEEWIDENFPVNWRKRLRTAALALMIVLFLISIPTALFALAQRNTAVQNAQQLEKANSRLGVALADAEEARRESEKNARVAELARTEEKELRLRAEQSSKEAGRLRGVAEQQSTQLEQQSTELAQQRDNARSGQLAAHAESYLPIDPAASLDMVADRKLPSGESVKETKDTENVLREALLLSRFRSYLGGKLTLPRGDGVISMDSVDGRHIITAGPRGRASVQTLDNLGRLTSSAELEAEDKHLQITAVSLSPDGKFAVTADSNGYVHLWNTASGDNLGEISVHPGSIYAAVFSPDGKWLVTGGKNGGVKLCGTTKHGSYFSRTSLTGHEQGSVYAAAFSPDGKHIVTASQDDSAIIWGVPDRPGPEFQKSSLILHHSSDVLSAAFSPDNEFVITGDDDGLVHVWSVSTGKELQSLRGHTGPVKALAFSHDGLLLVTASRDNTARIWNTKSWASNVLAGHTDDVLNAAFSHNDQFVVTASQDNTARVWDVGTGETTTILRGHKKSISKALFSFDDKSVITLSDDKTSRLWDATVGRSAVELKGHTQSINTARFSTDGRAVLTASADATARVWNVESGRMIGKPITHRDYVFDAVFSPNGKMGVTASRDNAAMVWEIETGRVLRTLSAPDGHRLAVKSATFSPDNRLVVTASEDGTIRIWNPLTNDRPKVLTLINFSDAAAQQVYQSLDTAMFTPDGNYLVTSTASGKTYVIDLKTSMKVREIHSHIGNNTSQAFTRDGTYIVTRDFGLAKLWDVKSGKHIRSYPNTENPNPTFGGVEFAHEDQVNSAAISPDGTLVVTASRDNTAKVWDLSTARFIAELRGHTDNVKSAVFSPHGNLILTASKDNTAQLWDAYTGRNLLILRGNTSELNEALFSPDGSLIITVGRDNIARLYTCEVCVPAEKLRDLAQTRRMQVRR